VSTNERITLFLTGAVSFLTIMATVWYAAVAVNNLTHEITKANTNFSKIEMLVTAVDQKYEVLESRVDILEIEVTNIKRSTPKAFIQREGYVVFEGRDGTTFSIKKMSTDAEGNSVN
jgi:mannose/fructose/N-acetylgalactosamine-specific phosphotransferase system component IIB